MAEGGGLESSTCGSEGGRLRRTTGSEGEGLESEALGLMEKHMAFRPGSEGGGPGSGLLTSGIDRTYSFLTLLRFWAPRPGVSPYLLTVPGRV